jgi:RND family efflux transporter MFP subunit
MKLILPLFVLITGVAAAWALMANRPQITPQKREAEPPAVEVVRVAPDTVRLNVRSQGMVRPRTEIDLVSEVAGRVTRIHSGFAAGGFFERGEGLIALDPRDYEDAIIKAQAEVAEASRALLQEEAEAEQARSEWQALGEGESTPLTLREPQLRERRAQFRAAQAALAEARRRRERCELRAPFTGQVREKRVDVGQYVAAGEKLARLYAVDAVEVRLPISQEQLKFLDLPLAYRDVGQGRRWPTVRLTASLAGRTYEWQGTIVRTEGAWDEQTGMLYAVAEVRDPYTYRQDRLPLAVGLYVQAEIEGLERSGVYVLPAPAVRHGYAVWVVDGEGRLRLREVEVQRSEAHRLLVSQGLRPGDQVVISALDTPVEGMRVRVTEGGP